MKLAVKAIIIGVISFVVLIFGNLYLGINIGILFGSGDVDSYFWTLYIGITFLSSLVISCAYLVVKKIENLIEEIKNK